MGAKTSSIFSSDHDMRAITQIMASFLFMILLGTSAQFWATKQNHILTGIAPLTQRIRIQRPQIVLLGNSILERGIEEDQLSALVGLNSMSIYQEGAASAWWYLALKNVVTASDHNPDRVFILFRDHYLTAPTFRTQGKFKDQLDMLRREDEPVLEALAKVSGQTPATKFLSRTWPFYQVHHQYRRSLERRTQSLVGSLFSISAFDLALATERVFSTENLDQNLFTQQQIQAEKATNTSAYDFQKTLRHSFLPELITVARSNNIDIGFIRFKRLRDISPGKEPPELVIYIRDLNAFIRASGSFLIDFTHDPRLRKEHYADGDHLNAAGQDQFTRMLAEELSARLPEMDIPGLVPENGPTDVTHRSSSVADTLTD